MITEKSNSETIDFIGVGAPKCGTTWIAQCMHEHPEILFPTQKGEDKTLSVFDKELNFFNEKNLDSNICYSNYSKGKKWYLEKFPKMDKRKVRGEITPNYLRDPKAFKRIKADFPNVKIIAFLREPVELMQVFHHYNSTGVDHRKQQVTFKEYIQDEKNREVGLHYKHLKKFFDIFPKENIHVVIFDDLEKKPGEILRDLFSFLQVDASFEPPSMNTRINETRSPKYPTLRNIVVFGFEVLNKLRMRGLYARLRQNRVIFFLYKKINTGDILPFSKNTDSTERHRNLFKEDVAMLEQLLKRDLHEWK